MKCICLLWFSLLTCLVPHAAIAQQNYPTRPIRLIVPYPPGGGTDFIGRTISEKLGGALSTNVLVDNRGGAAGRIGTVLAKAASPDGYTLLLVTAGTFSSAPNTARDLPYDPVRDFTAVSQIADQPYILAMYPGVGVQSVNELIKLAKDKPKMLSYASAGIGGSAHMWSEYFNHLAKVNIMHIPYKGNGPAIIDLVGGRVSILFSTIPSVVPHMKSGRLIGLVTTGAQRSKAFPSLPTMIESGLSDFNAGTWYGLVAPAKTPALIISTLNQAVAKVLKDQEVAERITREGAEVAGSSSEEFAKHIREEILRYGKILAIAGLKS